MESSNVMDRSNEARPIRVLIFDTTKMGCQLLAHMLEASPYNVKAVGSFTDEVLGLASSLPEADIALITVNAVDAPGSRFKLLREIRQGRPTMRCILLLERCEREQVVESFSSGVMGICGRNESCEVLCKCIHRVHHGQVWANSEQLHYVLESFCAGNRLRLIDAHGNALLTRREQSIVRLVAEGLRNREIARQLQLSEHTVRNYLFRVFDKLDVSSRSELILYTLDQRRRGPSVVGERTAS
jgi:DNA-binding NarL/FixJ family response regulator